MSDQSNTTEFQRGVDAMRKAAIEVCKNEARHADTHSGDPRYAGRKDGAESCATEIEFLEVQNV